MENLKYLFDLPVGNYPLGLSGHISVGAAEGEKNYRIKTSAGSLNLVLYKKHGLVGRKIGYCSADADSIINEAVRLHKNPQLMFTLFELAFLWSIIAVLVSFIATLTNPQNIIALILSITGFIVSLAYLKGHKND